jgi:Cu2+-exporting ATPase
MTLLIALAITVAYVSSLASSLGWGDLDFWWELAALIVVMLLGHWQEMKAIGQARSALAALAELLPDTAERVTGDGVEEVPLAELAVGDVVLVRPGGRVPADGEIVEGRADFDESMITGESRPVHHGEGEHVVAGTVSTDSSVRMRIRAVGDDTALAGIQRLVADAQSSQSRTQALADRAAAALFYVAVGSAALALLVWSLLGEPSEGVIRMVTVLVIACPHALGLAIPLVISISTATAAQAGILVKNRLALERMRTVDTVLFDKTGTLTRGNHAVVDHVAVDGRAADDVLALAAAAEADSEHPVARAVVAAARDRGLAVGAPADFAALTGRGVTAMVNGAKVSVGGPALLDHLGLREPDSLTGTLDGWRDRGGSVLYVVAEGEVVGALTQEDEVRPESHIAVDELHERDVRVAMITGDAQQVADSVAGALGIDEVFAEVLPADKDAKVAQLKDRNETVAMVGDGVNDAPALARADVGIAIGAGTDVAIDTADVVLMSSDPLDVPTALTIGRGTLRKMRQNLGWAIGYNLAALPLAAFGLVPPWLAAIGMSLSSVVVVLNAMRLSRVPSPGNRAAWPASRPVEAA